MDELNYLKKWLDRNIDEHTTAPIGEIDTKTLAEAIIKEGFSRRPELDEEELIPFLLTLRTFYNKDGDVDLTAIAKSICANFTAPEAKQREVKWPEKVDLTGFKDGYGKGSRDHIIAAAWNQAIDACKKAYEEAQPASSVNAEVVNDMLLRAYMDANKIPYQTVGDSNIENIMKYLCEHKIMPAHLMSKHIVKKYGLIDNQPSIEDAEKETKRLQKLANDSLNSIKAGKDTK